MKELSSVPQDPKKLTMGSPFGLPKVFSSLSKSQKLVEEIKDLFPEIFLKCSASHIVPRTKRGPLCSQNVLFLLKKTKGTSIEVDIISKSNDEGDVTFVDNISEHLLGTLIHPNKLRRSELGRKGDLKMETLAKQCYLRTFVLK